MEYTVLSPWAKTDLKDGCGINKRPETLEGKTIGLFAHFKQHSPILLSLIGDELKKRYNCNVTSLQYPVSTVEIPDDPEFDSRLKDWLKGVDCVVAALGDAGSCTLFLTYNTAYIEKLGVPAVLIANRHFTETARYAAKIRNVPSLRIVESQMEDLSRVPKLDENTIDRLIRPTVEPVMDAVIDALTVPASAKESEWIPPADHFADAKYKGDIQQINRIFYQNGWTNGTPVVPPTEELVKEMLRGTDLPADYVVGEIPPRRGLATVEKIAVNAVMAGCLPTYMPVLIACVKGMLDKRIHLEGWTCSASSWFPLIVLSGKITKDLDMATGAAAVSPYRKASATIAHAFQLIIQNIGGTRPAREDMSQMGHENRFGVCIGEDLGDFGWPSLHSEYGIPEDSSAVTLFWPHDHNGIRGNDLPSLLRGMCDVKAVGFDPGCAYILTPKCIEAFKKEGMSRRDVMDYICEYARKPMKGGNLRWISGNNHLPEGVQLPREESCSYRKFWTTDHLLITFAGNASRFEGIAFPGGGDHGGPSCTEIEFPSGWNDLVAEYKDYSPKYIEY